MAFIAILAVYFLTTERAGKPLPLEEFQVANISNLVIIALIFLEVSRDKHNSTYFGNHEIKYMDLRFNQRLGAGAFGVVFKYIPTT